MDIIGGVENKSVLAKRWGEDVIKKRVQIIAELPGIGPITARKIMDVAGDIMGLCMLSEHQLTEIEGVSANQAKDLFKFLHG